MHIFPTCPVVDQVFGDKRRGPRRLRAACDRQHVGTAWRLS
jgi:hypothetical protein